MSKLTQYVRHLAVVAIATLLAQCAWADYTTMNYTWKYMYHGDGETVGTTAGDWANIDSWGATSDAGETWGSYATASGKTSAPAVNKGSGAAEGAYDPMLVSGKFIEMKGKLVKGDDGKYHVNVVNYGNRDTLEGWNTRIGAEKDVYLTLRFNKLQSGVVKEFSIDASSKMVIAYNNANPQGNSNVHVWSPEGLTFGTAEADCNFRAGATWFVYPYENGSIKVFGNVADASLLQFKDAVVDPSTTGDYKKLSERVLLSYTGTSAGTFNAANSNAIVPSESSVTLAKVDRKPIPSTDAVGTYQIVNDTTEKVIKIVYVENSEEQPAEDFVTFIGEDGAWDTASNWSKGEVPTANDEVLISSAKTITLTTSSVAKSVTIAADATFTGAIDGTKIKGVTITDTSVLTINIASGASSLRNVSGGKIIKTGEGALRFSNDGGSAIKNTTIQIDEGMVSLYNGNQDAVLTSPTFIIGENGTLENKGWFTINGTFTIDTNYNKTILSNNDGGNLTQSKIGGGAAIVKKGTGVVTLRSSSNANFTTLSIEGGRIDFGAANQTVFDGVVSGSGAIGVNGTGGLLLNGENTFTGGTVITSGQLTLGNKSALGAAGNTVYIDANGTLDVNGKPDYLSVITMNGGTLKNGSNTNVGTSSAQIRKIILEADSTVDAGMNFGIVNNGHNATTLELNGHKLTKKGAAEFWLVNVTTPAAGMIEIEEGAVHVDQRACNLTGVTFTVPATATDKVVQNATTLNPAPAGTIYQQVERAGGDNIYITTGVGSYVLASGTAATLKANDVVVFDSHYTGEKWGSAPSFQNFAGHKVVVGVTMNLNGGITGDETIEIEDGVVAYLRGGVADGASITGEGTLYVGYETAAIGNATVSCGTFGFQPNGQDYTANIGGAVVIDSASTIATGSEASCFKLASGATLTCAELAEGKVTTDVEGKIPAYADGKYTLVDAAQELPGEEYFSGDDADAYKAWAEATGVTADTDHENAEDLAIAYSLGVTGTTTVAEALAAAKDKVKDLIAQIDLAALADPEGGVDAALTTLNANLPNGLQATLKQVPSTEIETNAMLYRLVINVIPANTEE